MALSGVIVMAITALYVIRSGWPPRYQLAAVLGTAFLLVVGPLLHSGPGWAEWLFVVSFAALIVAVAAVSGVRAARSASAQDDSHRR